jgi:tetratricopeptide (TPR) repeat protein
MPFTINGIGTHYYFKRNVVANPGVCEHCYRQATLSDYDIGHFLVVFYIPVLPLGRQMIISECNACGMHQTMPLRKYERLREQTIDARLQALAEQPESAVAALELLGTYTAFNQHAEAAELATAIRGSHGENYEALLSLGAWYEARQHHDLAEECFQIVVRLDPERLPSKRIRLYAAMEAKQSAEVKGLAQDLLAQAPHEHLGVALRAAQFLAEQQRFEDAYRLFQKLIELSPQLKKDKDFRRAARVAEQGVGLPASLVPPKKLGVID